MVQSQTGQHPRRDGRHCQDDDANQRTEQRAPRQLLLAGVAGRRHIQNCAGRQAEGEQAAAEAMSSTVRLFNAEVSSSIGFYPPISGFALGI